MAGRHDPVLVERDGELALFATCLADLHRGRGHTVVIEAVAGLGKTALIAAAVEQARARNVQVLSARSGHLAAAAPYDVLRRVLGPAVERRGGPKVLTGAAGFAAPLFTPGAEPAAGVDYGCLELFGALAEEGPLLVAVDDAHWADAESLRVLTELAESIDREPVMVLLAARPAENPVAQPLLSRMVTADMATLVSPAPLTEAGVRAVLRATFGREPDPSFTLRCATVSAGNVFYLRILTRPLIAAGLGPDAEATAKLAASGPEALARTVRARLGELGSEATNLAFATAVLGDGERLAHAAAMSSLSRLRASAEAVRLVSAAILTEPDPIAFPHSLVRASVEQSAPSWLIGELHARAARTLDAAGQPPHRIAEHYLAAPPAGSAEACRLLLAEGRRALDAGSAVSALHLLTRALDEPPPTESRAEVLHALARAERATGRLTAARRHLTEAIDGGNRPVTAAAMSDLIEVLYGLDDQRAVSALRRRAIAMAPFGASQEEVRLRAMLLAHPDNRVIVGPQPDLLGADPDHLPTGTGEERHLLLCAALYRRSAPGGSTAEFVTHLRRVVAGLPEDRPLSYWEVYAANQAAAYLAAAEQMDEADLILSRLRADVARLRGVAPDLQAEWNQRTTFNALRRGEFEEALARQAAADEFARRNGLSVYAGYTHYVHGWVHLEQGRFLDAGRSFLQAPADDGVNQALGHLLTGRPDEALASLGRFGLPSDPNAPIVNVEIDFEVHLVASHAHDLLGDRDAALAAADRDVLVRRRHGPAFRLGLALRRRASFAPARSAVALLHEAVLAGADTPRLPALARIRASYGAALVRATRLTEARAELARALDLADRLTLTHLAEQITGTLRKAGGRRPARRRITGAASLTPGQRAVVDQAVRGLTDREIANELYVTSKTVESHLNAAYRKLGISGRDGLKDALSGG